MGLFYASRDLTLQPPDLSVDGWLRATLHRTFDRVLTEPVPADLLGLLDDVNPVRQPARPAEG